jgi:hypothetical protein
MKLFNQLNEDEQHEALHHCADIVIEDLINDGIKLEPLTDEDEELKEKFEETLDRIKDLPMQDKIDNLLGDPILSQAIYDIALELAKGTYYMETGELILYVDDLSPDEEEKLLPEANIKKVSPLN